MSDDTAAAAARRAEVDRFDEAAAARVDAAFAAGTAGGLRDAVFGPSSSSSSSSYTPLLAIFIVSHAAHFSHRLAARATWLPRSPECAHVFVVGRDADAGFGPTHEARSAVERRVALESLAFGDVVRVEEPDVYFGLTHKVVAGFRWCLSRGAWYCLRANDDVYLDLAGGTLLPTLERAPPIGVYAGLFLRGSMMRVPRSEDFGMTQAELLRKHKVWAFSQAEYPSSALPELFAQGNAIVLSRDLVEMVVDVPRLSLPDDVLIGLAVEPARAALVHVPTGYELEGRWTVCHDENEWHFNLHPEHFYRIHESGCDGLGVLCCG